MQHVPLLTTLERVRAQRRLGADATGDDELLKTLIAAASAEFARETGRVCVPYFAERHFDMPVRYPYALDLDEDLLELAALTNGDGTAIPVEAAALRPFNAYPKWRITLRSSAGIAYTYADDPQGAITVAGWWGYAPHYDTAWRVSGFNAPEMTSGTIQLTLGATGVFETGHYLRIDDEVLRVTGRDVTTITLARGQLGTTAAAHNAGAAIRIFDVLPDIQNAVTEMVAYAYKSLDRVGGRVTVYPGTTVLVDDLDPLVRRALEDHRRKTLVVIR